MLSDKQNYIFVDKYQFEIGDCFDANIIQKGSQKLGIPSVFLL